MSPAASVPDIRNAAAAIAESVYQKNPKHPGALHYLIHAYDSPAFAPVPSITTFFANPLSTIRLYTSSHCFCTAPDPEIGGRLSQTPCPAIVLDDVDLDATAAELGQQAAQLRLIGRGSAFDRIALMRAGRVVGRMPTSEATPAGH